MRRRDVLKVAGIAGASCVMRSPLLTSGWASDTYRAVVLAKGPVGYWRLGEPAGPMAVDLSGAGYDGTYVGAPSSDNLVQSPERLTPLLVSMGRARGIMSKSVSQSTGVKLSVNRQVAQGSRSRPG